MPLPHPILLLLPLAAAQTSPGPDPYRNPVLDPTNTITRDPNRPLVEGFEDVGPLRTSLRILPNDPRQDIDFDNIYVVPGREDLLMRRSGGLTVVFPRSRYIGTREGPVAVTPPGAVFFIGEPTPQSLAAHFPVALDRFSRATASSRAPTTAMLAYDGARPRSTSVPNQPQGVGPSGDAAPARDTQGEPPPPTVWTSDLYRRERLEQLLAPAVAATRRAR